MVVVCDLGGYDTADVDAAGAMMAEFPSLRVTYIPAHSRSLSRKKLAVTLGVKAARHVWEPEVSFVGSDLRTIECLTEPITISGSEGKVTITSFQLRTLGVVITLAEGSDIPDFLTPTAVMKDGTEIPMGIGAPSPIKQHVKCVSGSTS